MRAAKGVACRSAEGGPRARNRRRLAAGHQKKKKRGPRAFPWASKRDCIRAGPESPCTAGRPQRLPGGQARAPAPSAVQGVLRGGGGAGLTGRPAGRHSNDAAAPMRRAFCALAGAANRRCEHAKAGGQPRVRGGGRRGARASETGWCGWWGGEEASAAAPARMRRMRWQSGPSVGGGGERPPAAQRLRFCAPAGPPCRLLAAMPAILSACAGRTDLFTHARPAATWRASSSASRTA